MLMIANHQLNSSCSSIDTTCDEVNAQNICKCIQFHWLWVWKHLQPVLSLGGNMGGKAKVSKTAVPMAESDKDTTWGIKALSSRSYKINLEKQHAIVFNFDTC